MNEVPAQLYLLPRLVAVDDDLSHVKIVLNPVALFHSGLYRGLVVTHRQKQED